MRNLLLPGHLRLAVDLGVGLPVLASIEENGAHDDFGAHDRLVVVDVGGSVGAVVAVDGVA